MFFRHRKVHSAGINTNAWMMSYADMATTLLAMFIVLSTLGKDQTGISLFNGTGSFVNAQESFGLPSFFSNSAKVIPLPEQGAHYQLRPSEDAAPGPGGTEGEDGKGRIIDGEGEQLQRFMREIDRQFHVEKLPRVAGQVVVDFYEPLNRKPPYLDAHQATVLGQVLPVLQRPNYRVEVVVWATTPSLSAWTRATEQARHIVEDAAAAADLDATARGRLLPVGQAWRYPDIRRPILSLFISKTEQP